MNKNTLGILGLFILIFGITWWSNDNFTNGYNMTNLVKWSSLYAIMGIGVAFVIITGGIDLSIGSVIGLVAALMALAINSANLELAIDDKDGQSKGNNKTLSFREIRKDVDAGDIFHFENGGVFTVTEGALAAVTSVKGLLIGNLNTNKFNGFLVKGLFKDKDLNTFSERPKPIEVKINSENIRVTIDNTNSYLPGWKDLIIEPLRTDLKVDDAIVFDDNTFFIVTEDASASITSLTGNIFNADLTPGEIGKLNIDVFTVYIVSLLLLLSVAIGMTHGLLITKVKLQPFVVTLCGLLIYRGISRWLTDNQTMQYSNTEWLDSFFSGKVSLFGQFSLASPFFFLVVIAILAAFFLNRTIWGRYLLALGNNEDGARYSGIQTDRLKITAYVICSFLAGVSGLLFAYELDSVQPAQTGEFYELYAIAAAVLGGCSLRGGQGAIFGVIIAAAVIRLLRNSINLVGISTHLEFAIIGLVILGGVTADELIKRFVAMRRTAQVNAAKS